MITWEAGIGILEAICWNQLLKKRSVNHEHTGTVSKGEYNLTTKARRKAVGRNKQLDEGTDVERQTWKYLDPLNCVASTAFS